MKQEIKHYIVRKYVAARSITEAVRLEKAVPVDDVWLDEDYHKRSFHLPPRTKLGLQPRVPKKRAMKKA